MADSKYKPRGDPVFRRAVELLEARKKNIRRLMVKLEAAKDSVEAITPQYDAKADYPYGVQNGFCESKTESAAVCITDTEQELREAVTELITLFAHLELLTTRRVFEGLYIRGRGYGLVSRYCSISKANVFKIHDRAIFELIPHMAGWS